MVPDNTTLSSCVLLFDSADFKVQAALRSIIGLFSSVCCALVVFISVLFKKYRFYTQRLILYLAIAAMLHGFSYSLTRVNYYSPRPIVDPYCNFGALLNHYTAANEILSVCFMTFNLVIKALFNRSTVKAEPLIVGVIFLLPAAWKWVPVWLGAYGTSLGWCDVRTFNTDCTRYYYEAWLQFGLRYIPLYTLMVTTLVSIVLVAVKMRMSSTKWVGRWSPTETATRESLRKEIQSLMFYPIIFILFNIFSLINQIYSAIGPLPPSPLIYLSIFTATLRGAFIALAFALDGETRQRLKLAQCKAACIEWVGRKQTVNEYTISGATFVESYHNVLYYSVTQ